MAASKVGFISQWFSPEPTVVPDGIAIALQERGFDVRVVTGAPNYPSGVVHDGYDHRRVRRDVEHGLAVLRTPLYPSHDQSAVGRIANYVSWALSSSLAGQRLLRRSDVNVVYGSPITAALPAQVARWLWRRPFVLIVQDVWPDSVFATGFLARGLLSRVAHGALTRYCNMVYRNATRVVVISPGMKRLLESRGVPEDKVTVIYNWVDEADPNPNADTLGLRAQLGLAADDFVLMYAGNHGPAQDLGALVRAVGALPDNSKTRLVMVGDGVEKPQLEDLARMVAPLRVLFLSSRPRSTMAELMLVADAQVVSLAPDPLFKVTVPSKLQSIMSAGHPVLAIAEGDVRELVSGCGCGVVAEPGNCSSIVAAISQLECDRDSLAALGLAGRDFYTAAMSETVSAEAYARVINDVSGKMIKDKNCDI